MPAGQVAAAYWEVVSDTCSSESQRYDTVLKDSFHQTIEGKAAEWTDDDFAVWPLSAENYQITSYVIVQAAQVVTVLTYETELRKSFKDPQALAADSYERARAATDLAECLMPVDDRFTTAEEEGISQLAYLVTKDVICTKWNEYSDRILELSVAGMTEEDYIDAWSAIGLDTIESCEERA